MTDFLVNLWIGGNKLSGCQHRSSVGDQKLVKKNVEKDLNVLNNSWLTSKWVRYSYVEGMDYGTHGVFGRVGWYNATYCQTLSYTTDLMCELIT